MVGVVSVNHETIYTVVCDTPGCGDNISGEPGMAEEQAEQVAEDAGWRIDRCTEHQRCDYVYAHHCPQHAALYGSPE